MILILVAVLAPSVCESVVEYGVEVYALTSILAGNYALAPQVVNDRPGVAITIFCIAHDFDLVYRRDSIYLYHLTVANETGRWMVGPSLGENNGIAYIDSWALTPSMIKHVSPLAQWKLALGFTWQPDITFGVRRLPYSSGDLTLHVSAMSLNHSYHLDGLYVETGLVTANHMVYLNYWRHQRIALYHHATLTHRWMIGDVIGAESCQAYVDVTVDTFTFPFNDTSQRWCVRVKAIVVVCNACAR
jgi:hypothetical protein